jgi:hypothetical protein
MSKICRRLLFFVAVGLFAATAAGSWAGESLGNADPDFCPKPLTGDHFSELKERSPFLRTLNFADTYRLRGVATIGGQPVAVLFNRFTKKTVQVTSAKANELGMKLVGVEQNGDLANVSVRLVIGGEEVEVAYDERQLAPQPQKKSSSRSYNKGGTPPPQSLVTKYRSMDRGQMAQYQKWRSAYIQKYPDQEHGSKRYQLGEKVIDSIKAGKGPPKVK